ncbi:MAG TPA: phosphatase PAP2 family protein, partial [Solirubrobacterales bacterium]|nr:phosphatase PAP2 family protein [Solirubrobacterales bacterium]
ERSVWRYLFLAFLCASGTAALALLFYGSTRISEFDARVTSHFLAVPDSRLDQVADFGARLAEPAPLILIAFGLIVLAVVWNRPWHLLAAGGVIIAANLTTQVMKALMAHPRLQGALGVSYPIEIHYPSGHTTAALASASGLWLVTPPRWRAWAAAFGAIYALAVAAGVVIAGWHFISDVIGAALVVGFWACLAMAALVQAGLERTDRSRESSRTR